MQTAKCKCGEKQSWGDLPPCSICEKCGTAPGYANAETAQSHRFSKKFDQNTGKPFNFCMVCGRKEEVLFEPKCSGCGHSEHKFLCLHTIELSNGEHDVCDCQSFSPAEPDATARARAFFTKQGKWDFAERFDGWRCCELMAAFLESETPRINENATLTAEVERLRAENERLREALIKIRSPHVSDPTPENIAREALK